ncbi:Peptidase inhibitor family I36 [Saccharopolyspora kobensis]|uniref:Peptidase inhibitor family I36 n=1 Tax=Saccharopolyspora kobensis TaxID=146035 RepID=A0A1H6D5V7_9PSEU|nr:peptidase inhibitor family I36 protein [Saccharopolyspora kobensis]SEG80662.1 Peptidase inhibitor family I36 [Saccharopolyspora kobensis]SFD12773.1 Peptidase inhibitor family I36 [Saccharopolyspora kobensis]
MSSFTTTATPRSYWTVRAFLAVLLALAAVLIGASNAHATSASSENPCPSGNFCVWAEQGHTGQRHDISIHNSTFEMERCIPLEHEGEALSFVNNTGHQVTAYQDPHCDTKADFATYPPGTHAPQATFVVRAIKVWSH